MAHEQQDQIARIEAAHQQRRQAHRAADVEFARTLDQERRQTSVAAVARAAGLSRQRVYELLELLRDQ